MIHGWEFFILNPYENIKECTQDTYLVKYNEAYNNFLKQLCIPEPTELLTGGTFLYFINCDSESDKLNLNDSYEYKFLKSIFFEKKYNRIKKDVIEYYKNYNIYVKRIYKTIGGYIIELEL
tara:strand:+ start:182 stop:544 length:363 start_codon:yes stop_codon:yes gene_type:complete